MSILQDVSKKVYKIYFDNRDLEQLFAVQNDTNARTYLFQIVSNNGVVQDLANVTLEFTVQMGDKKQSVSGELIDSEKGIYEVTLTSSMLQIAGVGQAQITLIDSTSAKLSSKDMTILIRPSLEFGGGTVEGEDLWFTFTMLTDAIADSKALREEYTQSLQTQIALHQDVTDKHGEVVSMYATLESVFESETERINAENARVSAENARVTAENTRVSAENARIDAEDTRKTNEESRVTAEEARVTAESQRNTDEDARVANEVVRETNEGVRKSQETTRQTQEGTRQTLYQQLKALQEVLGTDPAVELAQAVAALQDADLDFLEAWRASSHLFDPAKDLIAEAGTLYRLTHVIEDGIPWLKHIEVGKVILNDGMELTAPGDSPRMRLYWKAQGEADAYITAWAGEEQENRYVGEIDSYTKQYSAVFDLSSTRTVTLSTLTAWGQEVKIWDFDWRVEA